MKKLYSVIICSLALSFAFGQDADGNMNTAAAVAPAENSVSTVISEEKGAVACAPITICPQTNPYTGNVRGYWFVAPVAFQICGLFIPTDASTGGQSIEVLRFSDSIPLYPAFTNSFTSLFYTSLNPAATMIPCSINVAAGDTIGVYGARDNTTVNSYGMNPCATNILGAPVSLQRSGMQYPLWSQQMQDVWRETGGSISRTIMYVDSISSIGMGEPVSIPYTVAYPNPSTGNFTIESPENSFSLQIFNYAGEEVYSGTCTARHASVDLSAQAKGIYFVKVVTANGLYTQKLVVQ